MVVGLLLSGVSHWRVSWEGRAMWTLGSMVRGGTEGASSLPEFGQKYGLGALRGSQKGGAKPRVKMSWVSYRGLATGRVHATWRIWRVWVKAGGILGTLWRRVPCVVSVPMLVQGKAGRVWGCSRYKEEALPSSSFRIGSWENWKVLGSLGSMKWTFCLALQPV